MKQLTIFLLIVTLSSCMSEAQLLSSPTPWKDHARWTDVFFGNPQTMEGYWIAGGQQMEWGTDPINGFYVYLTMDLIELATPLRPVNWEVMKDRFIAEGWDANPDIVPGNDLATALWEHVNNDTIDTTVSIYYSCFLDTNGQHCMATTLVPCDTMCLARWLEQ